MKHRILVTGGAGFIGTNLAHRLASAGRPVITYDNLSRPGVIQNLEWLRKEHGALVRTVVADARQRGRLRACVEPAGQVFHLAAQVAVTTSLKDASLEFDVNLRDALNVLEAIRRAPEPPPLTFTSTNKVYGALDDLALRRPGEWRVADQRYYVSDISKFQAATGWTPKTTITEGVQRFYEWLQAARRAPTVAPAADGNGRARRNGRTTRRLPVTGRARRGLARA